MPTQTFTASGSFTPPAGVTSVNVLVVAGGGGGAGAYGGGGGGAGGVVTTYDIGGSSYSVTPGTPITVTIGAGGSGGNSGSSYQGTNGGNSVFGSITATGGGGGGYGNSPGINGGSGGGAGAAGEAGGTGSLGQNGGTSNNLGFGGGGGYSTAGGTVSSGYVGGAGGNGYTSSISGSSTNYAGGGGGFSYSSGTASGGTGGGGAGGQYTSYIAPTNGTANTGGGGGGGGNSSGNQTGGNGGSGVVIVSWTNPPPVITSSATMSAIAGQAATYQITATNSPTSYGFTWIIPSSGSSSFNSSTGLFSITPSAAGTYSFTVTATNSAGTGSQNVTMTALSVTGPSSSVIGDVALFANTSGTVLEDGGALGSAAFVSSSMGGDLSGTLPNPTVAAIHETGGPTQLVIGSVPNGSFLKRSGATLVGGTPSGAGNVTGPSSSTDGNLALFNGTTGEIIKDGGPYQPLVATVAALRALTAPTVAQYAVVSTYASGLINGGGDGGGGIFLFDPLDTVSRDDGGTIFVPGGSAPVVNSAGVITTPGTLATVGAWHRLDGMQGVFGGEGRKNVQWFGAVPDNGTDNTPAFRLAVASIVYSSGCIYIPAGQYALLTKWVINMGITGGTLSIRGDGPGATILSYGMATSDTCLIEVTGGFGNGSFQDLQVRWGGYNAIYDNPCVMWVHATTNFTLLNVQFSGLVSTTFGNGVLQCGPTNTNLEVIGCIATGGFGTQIAWTGGSGIMQSCQFSEANRGPGSAWVSGTSYVPGQYVSVGAITYMSRYAFTSTVTPGSDPAHWEAVANINLPCALISSSNTLMWQNNFFSGGGPWASLAGSTIASSGGGATFTVTTPTTHSFIAGDYIVIAGASQSVLNNWWKVASVTSNTVVISYTNTLSADSGTLSSLWSCLLIQPASGQLCTESHLDFCFINTGGGPGAGSVGLFCDGWYNASSGAQIGEWSLSNSIMDYGNCSVFLHGKANSTPASSCHQITLANCRPNGGPRDSFGCIRIEGCTTISIDGCRMFPGNNNPPGTGETFNSIVVSDGGQAYNTQDIAITGGIATNQNSSALYPSASIYAFTFDGPNVSGVRVFNVGMDVSSSNAHVSQFINGASISNGIGILYFDSNGYINSTGVLIAGVGSGSNRQNVISAIADLYNVYFAPELGYTTSGTIALNFGQATNALIGLTGNASFASSSLSVGAWMLLSMKNTTGSTISLSWPSGWNWSNGASAPTGLASGASLTFSIFSYGTSDSTVYVR